MSLREADRLREDVPGITRHRFPEDVERSLARLRGLDNWHGPLALLTDWAVIIGAAAVTERFSGWAWWPVYLVVALPVIGTRQRALATLLHEATHRVLAKNRALNMFLGTVPSAHLVLQSHRTYERSHLRDHHGGFGNPRTDPDLRAHIASGLYRPMTGRAFTLRYLLAPLVGVRTLALVKELLVSRLAGNRSEITAGLGVLLYVGSVGAVFTATGAGRLFLAYWLVPLFLVFPLVNWYIELLEHFPLVGRERVDIRASRPRAVGWFSRHLLGIHNEGYHLDHHLSTKIPFWNLPAAHRLRLRDPHYRAAVEASSPPGTGLLWQFRDMARQIDAGTTTARIGELGHTLPELARKGGSRG
ncbi:fatty acid desaturase family protein [Allokutzneria sp. A3M-2-11 16]|uniref:fatty acid desaturase family protein n=1 Tax=Allokutzneria sp. A3M-2-11 16 TaxID=2962043 RepID=UPI0020B8BBEA|nr:fatty acid desaturase family protein [Allokutzneria sp. A3M-2-11 16]MCP3803354.1 fatty acid desaturase family protein [Allokutzneria sp. A3M-2-11 16]